MKIIRAGSYESLYRLVDAAYRKWSENANVKELVENKYLKYEEIKARKRTIHVLGEIHCSRMPFEYTHQNLWPEMQKDSKSWIILREGKENVREPYKDPIGFYLQELARLCNMPYEEALADIYAEDTRLCIRTISGMSEEDIDRFLVFYSMCAQIITGTKTFDASTIGITAKNIKKPYAYAKKLCEKGPIVDNEADFAELFGKPWNEISKMRFEKLLISYTDKTNVLVSVGHGHLPAFRI